MTKRSRSTFQRQFRLYPIASPGAEPAHALDDCQWRARHELPCGVCDSCLFDQSVHHTDHPVTLSRAEAAKL